MKLVSLTSNNGKRLECEMAFDTGLIKEVEKASPNEIYFSYSLGDFRTCFPIDVLEISFTAILMNENMFLMATLHINGDDSPVKEFLNSPSDYYGLLECEAFMSDGEKNSLLLYLLKHLMSDS